MGRRAYVHVEIADGRLTIGGNTDLAFQIAMLASAQHMAIQKAAETPKPTTDENGEQILQRSVPTALGLARTVA